MKSRWEIATSKFLEGYNCAQAVIFSFCEDLNLDKETALKLSCGFGAGMGRKQEVCGAVSGGILAIGAKYGRNEQTDATATETTYKKTQELMNSFSKKHGTYICRKLLDGCELTTDEGQMRFKENKFKNAVCIPCVQSTVEILETLIDLA
jgi:C_GCAxxG_C_C family probable redox protein